MIFPMEGPTSGKIRSTYIDIHQGYEVIDVKAEVPNIHIGARRIGRAAGQGSANGTVGSTMVWRQTLHPTNV